mgnify:CR=1 FL=1
MKEIKMEFYKGKRRHIWLSIIILIFAQMAWAIWASGKMDDHRLAQGWIYMMYQFPIINSIVMPILSAVIASRICDTEHKGDTLKLMYTITKPHKIFNAKLIYGGFYVITAVLLQVVAIIFAGKITGFKGSIPYMYYFYYGLFTAVVSLTILLLHQILSLQFKNQMISFAVGLFGAFLGLFSMFFPQRLQLLLLWGYYGVLMFVNMNWDRATRIMDLYYTDINWSGFVLLIIMFLFLYLLGVELFKRKEM